MRYLSGLKPTGKPHMGNYFGMLKPLVDSQSEKNETYVFIPDYHALTSVTDSGSLWNMTWDCVETALAIGLTRPNTHLYLQSQFPEVQELTWYLSARATVSEMERSHAYKDALANGKTPNHALFAYPVLMAADILLFGAQIVPVGKDQKQHVEFARDWAQSFHRTYGETFVIPEPQISESVGVVTGTDGRKMSKSYGNVIGIFDDEAMVKKAIMGIVTDSKEVEEPKDPETCNVFAIYKLMATPAEQEEMREKYLAGGFGYGHAKLALLEKFLEYFGPMRERKKYYETHREEVIAILRSSEEHLRPQVDVIMKQVRGKVGIVKL